MNADTLIGASIALSGTLIGALVGVIRDTRQFRREKWWLHQEKRRERIELLYGAIVEHRTAYQELLVRAVEEVTSGRRPQTAVRPIPWERLSMLIGLYAPELENILQRIEQ